MSKAVIITGATGTQGGALIDALLAANADLEIVGVSRDASSNSSQRLTKKSPKIKMITGNLEKAEEIFINAKKATTAPIWGVYSVQTVGTLNPFDDPELRQGKALVDAALKNNVEFFVYSSVARGDDSQIQPPTDVPHFISKHEIEQHLMTKSKGTNMSYTILRPVAFMNNLRPGFPGKAFATIWSTYLPKKSLQLVAPSDIGYFGAQAMLNPDEYRNKAVSLAGDELTYTQFEQIYKEKTGQPLQTTYRFVAWLLLSLSRDAALMFKWFNTDGYAIDIGKLKKVYPGLKNFGEWLEVDSPFVERKKA